MGGAIEQDEDKDGGGALGDEPHGTRGVDRGDGQDMISASQLESLANYPCVTTVTYIC